MSKWSVCWLAAVHAESLENFVDVRLLIHEHSPVFSPLNLKAESLLQGIRLCDLKPRLNRA